MKNRLLFFLSSIPTLFPIILLPIPWWGKGLLFIAVYVLFFFPPMLSSTFETALWVFGIITLFTHSFDLWVYIVSAIAFIYWLISTIAFLISFYGKNRTRF